MLLPIYVICSHFMGQSHMTTPEFKELGRRNQTSEINLMASTAVQDRRNEGGMRGEPGLGSKVRPLTLK